MSKNKKTNAENNIKIVINPEAVKIWELIDGKPLAEQREILGEVTLAEASKLCSAYHAHIQPAPCSKCPLSCVICQPLGMSMTPNYWNVKPVPKLTDGELAILRATGAKYATRDEDGDDMRNHWIYLWSKDPGEIHDNGMYDAPEDTHIGYLIAKIFPSIHSGDKIDVILTEHNLDFELKHRNINRRTYKVCPVKIEEV